MVLKTRLRLITNFYTTLTLLLRELAVNCQCITTIPIILYVDVLFPMVGAMLRCCNNITHYLITQVSTYYLTEENLILQIISCILIIQYHADMYHVYGTFWQNTYWSKCVCFLLSFVVFTPRDAAPASQL